MENNKRMQKGNQTIVPVTFRFRYEELGVGSRSNINISQ